MTMQSLHPLAEALPPSIPATPTTSPLMSSWPASTPDSNPPVRRFKTRQEMIEHQMAELGLDPALGNYPALAAGAMDIRNPHRRGIVLVGVSGCGKTERARVLETLYDVRVEDASSLCLQGLQAMHGTMLEWMDVTGERLTQWSSEKRPYDMIIDDLGQEAPQYSFFGTPVDVLSRLVEARYRLFQSRGGVTIFTTQLLPEQMAKRYPAHTLSRIMDMCSVCVLPHKSWRKTWEA
jgi:hypothetical protein